MQARETFLLFCVSPLTHSLPDHLASVEWLTLFGPDKYVPRWSADGIFENFKRSQPYSQMINLAVNQLVGDLHELIRRRCLREPRGNYTEIIRPRAADDMSRVRMK
ncbi:hypothetical protein F5X96DRAFT_627986 [Biscogniauxia mediterranea]|nr:hypothetical protein F5X96DRAFT_627986 [Biscogniauxia mediterranea]